MGEPMTTTTVSCRHYLTARGDYPGLVDPDHLLEGLGPDTTATLIVDVTAPDRQLLVREVHPFGSTDEGMEGVRRLKSEGLSFFFAEDHAGWTGKSTTDAGSPCRGWLDVEALEGD